MDDRSSDQKYTLVLQGEVKTKQFSDAKSAAVAFYDADPAAKPAVILEEKQAVPRYLGTTTDKHAEGKGGFEKSLSERDQVADKAFRSAYLQISKERQPLHMQKHQGEKQHARQDQNKARELQV